MSVLFAIPRFPRAKGSPLEGGGGGFPRGHAARGLLLVVLLSCCQIPCARAEVAPQVLFARTRVARSLNDEQRFRAHQLASSVEITIDPKAFHDAFTAQLQPDDPPLAFEVYASVAHVEVREQIMIGFTERAALLRAAERAFGRYISSCHHWMRSPRSSAPPVQIDDRRQTPPRLVIDEMGLDVYRLLPWPENYGQADQRKLLQCAEADRDLCRAQQRQLKVAREHFHQGQHDWFAKVAELSNASAQHSEGWLKLQRAGKVDPEH